MRQLSDRIRCRRMLLSSAAISRRWASDARSHHASLHSYAQTSAGATYAQRSIGSMYLRYSATTLRPRSSSARTPRSSAGMSSRTSSSICVARQPGGKPLSVSRPDGSEWANNPLATAGRESQMPCTGPQSVLPGLYRRPTPATQDPLAVP